ncbi:hypothetical protein JKY72_03745 [Candidatus Gracilibacteria bacterium]|nr:hypothetical protein [Candidatus Gracilibacteria bacterium]
MSWNGWQTGRKEFPGYRVNIDVDDPSGWINYLVAPLSEGEPDKNHIHLKCAIRANELEWVVASVKVDGIRVINRRKLIEAVNRETGLNLSYR